MAFLGRYKLTLIAILIMASVYAYLRVDAFQDARNALERDQLETDLETLEDINDALTRPLYPDDILRRLCAHAGNAGPPDMCRD